MKKYAIVAALSVLVLSLLLGGTAYYTYSEYAPASVDIVADPTIIFDQPCMAPGDVFTKTVNVYNKGTLDYNYSITCSQTGGDASLYDYLMLEIKKPGQMQPFYSGPMSGMGKQAIGTLAAGNNEQLLFTVSFPKEADNAYQLTATDVNFSFVAEAHDPPNPCGKVYFEHPIINNQFVMLKGSSLPIKFHLIDCKTGKYEMAPRQGITLEVIGPNDQGVQMVYKFSLNDSVDRLKWDENLLEPHYIAVFSTKTYPVLVGGHYRAQVKDNGTVIGYIDFTVNEESDANRSNSQIIK